MFFLWVCLPFSLPRLPHQPEMAVVPALIALAFRSCPAFPVILFNIKCSPYIFLRYALPFRPFLPALELSIASVRHSPFFVPYLFLVPPSPVRYARIVFQIRYRLGLVSSLREFFSSLVPFFSFARVSTFYLPACVFCLRSFSFYVYGSSSSPFL